MSKHGPILWLDDDEEDQQIIFEALEELKPSQEVKFFSSGEALLAFLRSLDGQPFLILCDVNMPGIDGLQVRDEINKDPSLRKKAIPFVFFSTTAREPDVQRAYDMVVQGYFEKGNNFNELKSRIKRILDYWNDCRHPNSYTPPTQ
jgi:CheY-like chemotaxis protein